VRQGPGFSLLEVLLATAIFSIAVLGLALNLDTMVGVVGGVARLQESQRALDSAAMRLLATSNSIPPSDWGPVSGQEKNEIQVKQQVKRVEEEAEVQIPAAPGLRPAPVRGWVVVRMRTLLDGEPVELKILCNERR